MLFLQTQFMFNILHMFYKSLMQIALTALYLASVSNQDVLSRPNEFNRTEKVKIDIEINGISDTNVILAHYLNKSIYPDDTIILNSNGQGTFRAKKPYHQGMYIIYLPKGSYFEFIMGEDQEFSMKTDTINFVDKMEIKGSDENLIFFDFQRYMISKKDDLRKYQDILRDGDAVAKKDAREKLEQLARERKEKIQQISAQNPGLFVSTFLKGTLEIEMPEPPKKINGEIDSAAEYQYYKAHYFDNFNPSDGRLLYTPLYEDKVMFYLQKVILQIPDTLIKEIDNLMEGAMSDSSLFRYLLITLFNHYGNSNIMGFDAIQVHLADKYYLKHAWWTDKKFLSELEERVKILKPLTLGNVAPDVELLAVPANHFSAAENDTSLKKYPHIGELFHVSQIKADFIVLFFWEATCSHCKTVVPEMYKIYKEQLENDGVKVIAISTLSGEDGKMKWIDFVNKNRTYDWINAWNPYDYQYKILYDIRSTPQIFILDKDKKIIGKRIGAEQVPDLIDAYKKQLKD